MKKPYCLTVDVKSPHIENGLGYMISFALPANDHAPEMMGEFSQWHEAVRHAVLQAGDAPFSNDPYTRKLAVANLMHTLDDLNKVHAIRIGGVDGVPAVQIRSSNPYDPRIDLDFVGVEGRFRVTETTLDDAARAGVQGHGTTRLIEGHPRDYPFEKTKPASKQKAPPAFRPRP